MYFVYILFSEKCNRFYIGYSADIEARLIRHNKGMVTASKNCRPYRVCTFKPFPSEIEARREELRIKKQKSRNYIESLKAGNW